MLETRLPFVAAPMAGGATTVELIRAVTAAGGFGFLPTGYRAAAAVSADLDALAGTEFGINLFVPSSEAVDPDEYERYAERLGLDIPPLHDDDDWAAKIDLLTARPVAWVSFTFGLPSAEDAATLRAAGIRLAATVTDLTEAEAAAALGVDALIAQGVAAGGHSAIFDPRRPLHATGTADLVRSLTPLGLPVVAAGGVDGPVAFHGLLTAGAAAVAVGTLLLRTDEAGTHPTHRAALADPRFDRTVLTHAFTGRPARGLLNRFIHDNEAAAPFGYPELHHLTRGLRSSAAAAGDPDHLHLWAGTGWREARTGPASETIAWLTGR